MHAGSWDGGQQLPWVREFVRVQVKAEAAEDKEQTISTRQVTLLQAALGYQKSSQCGQEAWPPCTGLDPAGSTADLRQSASAVGGAQGSPSLSAGRL